jgi:hypothetical protein
MRRVAARQAEIAQSRVAQALQLVARLRAAAPLHEAVLHISPPPTDVRHVADEDPAHGSLRTTRLPMVDCLRGLCDAGCDRQHTSAYFPQCSAGTGKFFGGRRHAAARGKGSVKFATIAAICCCDLRRLRSHFRRDFADARHPLGRRCGGRLVVTDNPQYARRRAHRDGEPRIGIEHRLAHPIEARRRQ